MREMTGKTPPCRAHVLKEGLTLIEILIAMTVVAIGITLALQADAVRWSIFSRNKNLSAAIRMIENRAEELKAAIRSNQANFPAAGWTETVTDSRYGTKLITTAYSAVNPVGDTLPNVRKIIFTASWVAGKPPSTVADTLKIVTYVAQNL
jgi:prepilin-type N-terminal cleavage/methylation domain-containing protein